MMADQQELLERETMVSYLKPEIPNKEQSTQSKEIRLNKVPQLFYWLSNNRSRHYLLTISNSFFLYDFTGNNARQR